MISMLPVHNKTGKGLRYKVSRTEKTTAPMAQADAIAPQYCLLDHTNATSSSPA
jgi:hypothetical protein